MKKLLSTIVFLLAVLFTSPLYGQSLHVTSFPDGANVLVDNMDTGKVTPMSVSLSLGTHIVVVQLSKLTGWNVDTRTVNILSGDNTLSVTLLPQLTQGPPGPQGLSPVFSVGPVSVGVPNATLDNTNPLKPILNLVLPPGLPGLNGANGKDSTVPGPVGPAGAASTIPGPQGIPGQSIVGPAGGNGAPGRSAYQGYWLASASYQQADLILRPIVNPGDPTCPFVNITGGNTNSTGASADPWENSRQFVPDSPWIYICGTLPPPPTALTLNLSGDPTYVGQISWSSSTCNVNPIPSPISGTLFFTNTADGNIVTSTFPNNTALTGQVAFTSSTPSTILSGSVGRSIVTVQTPQGSFTFFGGSINQGSNGWSLILIGGAPFAPGCGDASVSLSFQLQP